MKFELFIAKRYLLKGEKKSFISVISLVSIIGIAIGVAALIIALGLITGFQKDVRDKILNSTAHIMVNNIIDNGFADYDNVINQIKGKYKNIRSATPVVYGTVLIKGYSRNASGAILRGIRTASPMDEKWLNNLDSGKLPLEKNELILGRELAQKLGLDIGDSCMLITPKPVLSPTGFIPKIKRFNVSGIFRSGLYEVDNGTIITGLASAQTLFGLKKKINYIQIYLKDIFAAEEVAKNLRNILPVRLQVITWKELNASLYSALELEKTVLFFTLTLIIVVAALNIIAGLILLVIQKIRDIGILLSCGASARTIKKIFFIQGGIIGFTGTSLGVIIGMVFIWFANKFELIRVPAEIYQMSHVPFKITLFDLGLVILVALVISLTATFFPAKKAASVNVVDAVKNE